MYIGHPFIENKPDEEVYNLWMMGTFFIYYSEYTLLLLVLHVCCYLKHNSTVELIDLPVDLLSFLSSNDNFVLIHIEFL